jgi:arginase
MHNIAVIGVPMDMGAGRRGVDMGPGAMRYTGLHDRLRELGCPVRDLGNVPVPLLEMQAPPAPAEKPRYLEPIADLCSELAARVAAAVTAGYLPLVLGGDHSIAMGSVGGSSRGRSLGLIWIDAHADFNTAETSPSGNIHGMPLAALTGRGHPRLITLGSDIPAISPEHVAIVGVHSVDPQEREALYESGILTFTMHDIDRRGIAAVMEEAIARITSGTDGFHISFDLDVVDPREAPGVGTPVPGGISYREAHLAMEMLAQTGKLCSLDLVEVNPILDDRNVTAELAAELALSALGKRIL